MELKACLRLVGIMQYIRMAEFTYDTKDSM